MTRLTCASCGEVHDLAEISLGADRPVQWELLSPAGKLASELGEEQCVIRTEGKTHYFVRACLDIPVRHAARSFTWGVWVSLSEKNFLEMSRHWHDPERVKLGPYFGWLCTLIPGYPDTVFLKTMVHAREPGLRPTVELEETEHPLSVHQRQGIPEEELHSIVMGWLHRETLGDPNAGGGEGGRK